MHGGKLLDSRRYTVKALGDRNSRLVNRLIDLVDLVQFELRNMGAADALGACSHYLDSRLVKQPGPMLCWFAVQVVPERIPCRKAMFIHPGRLFKRTAEDSCTAIGVMYRIQHGRYSAHLCLAAAPVRPTNATVMPAEKRITQIIKRGNVVLANSLAGYS